MSSPLLCVRGVKTYYGKIAALNCVDVEVGEGEIVALIGANGAGKSTLMMTICGNPRAREGSITFAGHDITRLPTHEIAHLKIAQAPDGRRIDGPRVLQGRHRPCFRVVSPSRGAHPSAWRHALGRRATDAGDRARADEPPAPAPARRTLARTRPADCTPDFRGDPQAQYRRKAHGVSGGT